MMKCLLVAGTQSGIGKTTITLAILKALKDSGYSVQSFKVGPDFIDPSHLEKVTDEPCYNLDSFMMGDQGVRRELAKGDADYAVIEGAMGLYDGISSCAKIADLLKIPILLIVDASASSESVARRPWDLSGNASFTPNKLTIAGVIANRVGSKKHAESIRRSLKAINVPLIGTIEREASGIPSRHRPGTWTETSLSASALKPICDSLDIEFIQPAAAQLTLDRPQEPRRTREAVIGIAMDAAFCFDYRQTVESIDKHARSPIPPLFARRAADVEDWDFGGGYPELHATQLSANRHLLDDVRTNADDGMPIYGECGAHELVAVAVYR